LGHGAGGGTFLSILKGLMLSDCWRQKFLLSLPEGDGIPLLSFPTLTSDLILCLILVKYKEESCNMHHFQGSFKSQCLACYVSFPSSLR
jgi:hypothetical protein